MAPLPGLWGHGRVSPWIRQCPRGPDSSSGGLGGVLGALRGPWLEPLRNRTRARLGFRGVAKGMLVPGDLPWRGMARIPPSAVTVDQPSTNDRIGRKGVVVGESTLATLPSGGRSGKLCVSLASLWRHWRRSSKLLSKQTADTHLALRKKTALSRLLSRHCLAFFEGEVFWIPKNLERKICIENFEIFKIVPI